MTEIQTSPLKTVIPDQAYMTGTLECHSQCDMYYFLETVSKWKIYYKQKYKVDIQIMIQAIKFKPILTFWKHAEICLLKTNLVYS